MHPSPSIPLLRRAAGLAAASVLALSAAACSDSVGDGEGGGGDVAGFCDRYLSLAEHAAGIEDPTDQDFADAVEAFAELDAPDEIADDWDTVVESARRLAEVDLSDPAAFEDMDIEEANQAAARVDAFIEEECDDGE